MNKYYRTARMRSFYAIIFAVVFAKLASHVYDIDPGLVYENIVGVHEIYEDAKEAKECKEQTNSEQDAWRVQQYLDACKGC